MLALCAQGLRAAVPAAGGAYGATLGAGAATGAERTGTGGNPAAFAPGGFGIRGDAHRPYGLADLRVAEAGAFADGARAGAALDWACAGIEGLWRGQSIRMAPAIRAFGLGRFPGALDLGAAWTWTRTEWPGLPPEWDGAPSAGLVWEPWPRLRAGAFRQGIPGTDGAWQFGFSAGGRHQELRLDFRRAGPTPWRTLASLSLRPVPAFGLTAGLATPPFQASLGVDLAWRGLALRQAARYHRDLGRTWLSGAGWSRRAGD